MKSTFEKDTLYTLLVKIPSTICVLVYLILITRLLGPEGNGVYTFIFTNTHIAMILLNFGTKSSSTYFIAKRKLAMDKIMGLGISFLGLAIGVMSILLLLVYFDIGIIRSLFLPSAYTEVFYLVFILLLFLFKYLFISYQSVFTGLADFKQINVYQLISSLLQASIIGGVYTYCRYYQMECSVAFVFSWILFIEFINTSIYTVMFLRKIPLKVNFRLSYQEEFLPFFQYGIKGYAYSIAEYMNKRLDVWLIEIYRGIAMLGQYGLATQISNFVLELMWPVNMVLFPYLTKMEKEEGTELFCRIFRFYVLLYLFFAACIWSIADWMVPFVFGVAFMDSIFPLKLLIIAIVFGGIRNVLSIYNKAYNRQRFSIIGTYLGLSATVVLGLWWIPIYGIVGAACVTLAAYGLTAVFMFATLLPHINRPFYLLLIPQKSDWEWMVFHIKQLAFDKKSKQTDEKF